VPERFAWYDRLSANKQRIYRKSDAILEVPLHGARAMLPLVEALRQALGFGDAGNVQPPARKLMRALTDDLGVPALNLQILEVRPRDASGELHGLYTWEEGKPAVIQVWMRTAVNERIVAFKSFLRTLLHELCHHLDYHHYRLDDSLHTRGFYAREASLSRQLLVDEPAPRQKAVQLRLPGF
jgi:hypothetical protein